MYSLIFSKLDQPLNVWRRFKIQRLNYMIFV